jgi:ribosomal protein S27E
MAESNFLKCSCQKCGRHIEFPATGAGAIIGCPHCGAQTLLISDSPRAAIPPTTRRFTPALVLFSVLLILVLVSGILVVVIHLSKKQKETVVSESKTPVQVESPKERSLLPGDSRSDFNIGKISLQKTEGSGLVYAVGTIKNALDRQRFGVRIELNLLDEQDQNIGVASDYASVIEPHKEWQFKALLAQPKTVKVTVADITEQQ